MTINLKQSLSERAQAIIACNPLIAVIDTIDLTSRADIIRIVFTSSSGDMLFDRMIQPQRSINTQFTGIAEEQLLQAPTLAECWDDIQCYLRGSLILAYNLDFVVAHLRENADHYGLLAAPVIGVCLQKSAQAYFGTSARLSLQSACQRIGYGYPSPAWAHDRAQAIVALLQAMAKGRKVAVPSTIVASVELEESYE